MDLRYSVPFLDHSVRQWPLEARLLRWLTFVWLALGLIVLFSASYAVADADPQIQDGFHFLKRQLMWVGVGLVGFQVVVHCPLRRLLNLSPRLFLIVLGLIILTFIPGLGQTELGATRWIGFGPIRIQPSEFIKPFLILQGALLFGQWKRLTWTARLSWLGFFCITLIGILMQPNLSTTALCGISLWLIALASGLRYSYLVTTALGGMLLGTLSIMLREYQRRRVMSFLNPWLDPQGDGYQLTQSLMAIGSGGATGNGFGLSMQKMFYLPIQETDFIFSVFAEEFGFVGCVLLIGLLVVYATLALRVAQQSERPVYRLVAVGAMILLVGQALFNIGVAIGALPTTGLPFPFFSYGGSSMIASLIIAGLLIRVAREAKDDNVVTMSDRRSGI